MAKKESRPDAPADAPRVAPPGQVLSRSVHGPAAPIGGRTGLCELRTLLRLTREVPPDVVSREAAAEIRRLREALSAKS